MFSKIHAHECHGLGMSISVHSIAEEPNSQSDEKDFDLKSFCCFGLRRERLRKGLAQVALARAQLPLSRSHA